VSEEKEKEELSHHRRKSPENRTHLTTQLQRDLSDWCANNALIQNGSLNHSLLNFLTYLEAYNIYILFVDQTKRFTFCFSGFYACLASWSIKPLPYGKYACPLCYLLYQSGKTIAEIEDDVHSLGKDLVWALYRSDISSLKLQDSSFVLLIMDYCIVHELGYVSLTTDEERPS